MDDTQVSHRRVLALAVNILDKLHIAPPILPLLNVPVLTYDHLHRIFLRAQIIAPPLHARIHYCLDPVLKAIVTITIVFEFFVSIIKYQIIYKISSIAE